MCKFSFKFLLFAENSMAYENQPKSEYETINDDTQHCLKEQPPHAPDYLELLPDNDCDTSCKTGNVNVSDQMQCQYDEKNSTNNIVHDTFRRILLFSNTFFINRVKFVFWEDPGVY